MAVVVAETVEVWDAPLVMAVPAYRVGFIDRIPTDHLHTAAYIRHGITECEMVDMVIGIPRYRLS